MNRTTMEVHIKSIYYLLSALYIISHASCTPTGLAMLGAKQLESGAPGRQKRKVSQLDRTSSGALEYMEMLRKKYSDSEGRPAFQNKDDPTSIWCILDRDMVNKTHRPRPSSPAKCTVQNRFIFNWNSVLNGEHESQLPVQKAIIRAYLKPIRRLLRVSPTPMDINIDVHMLGEDRKFPAATETIEVTMSTSWLEIEVTRGVSKLWPPALSDQDVEFIINLSVDCKKIRKVPATFINPTEIEVEKAKRRERYEPFQPLFLMFFNDKDMKDTVFNDTMSTETIGNEEFPQDTAGSNREKRSASACRLVDFPVVFQELHLNYVIVPYMYNAKQCIGSCSHHELTTNHQLGTNHANIMAAAFARHQGGQHSSLNVQPPNEPCCVPTRYSAEGLVINTESGLQYKIYPMMVVEECGCR